MTAAPFLFLRRIKTPDFLEKGESGEKQFLDDIGHVDREALESPVIKTEQNKKYFREKPNTSEESFVLAKLEI